MLCAVYMEVRQLLNVNLMLLIGTVVLSTKLFPNYLPNNKMSNFQLCLEF